MEEIYTNAIKKLTTESEQLLTKLSQANKQDDYDRYSRVNKNYRDTLRLIMDIEEHDKHMNRKEITYTISGEDNSNKDVTLQGVEYTDFNDTVIEPYNGKPLYANHWTPLFEKAIKDNRSLVFDLPYDSQDQEWIHRGTGKTYALLNIASKHNNCVFLTINMKSNNIDEYTALYDGCVSDIFNNYELDLIGKNIHEFDNKLELRFVTRKLLNMTQYKDKIILIDDTLHIDNEVLNKLKQSHIVLGFRAVTNNNKESE